MSKSRNNKPGFSFQKLAGTDNYKKWAREMQYSLEFIGLWDYTLSNKENPKPMPLILKNKDLEDIVKLEYQEKRIDKIIA